MSDSTQKLERIQRLRGLEENKMQSLAVELTAAQAELHSRQEELRIVTQQINSSTLPEHCHDVQSHRQSLVWIDHLEKRRETLSQLIADKEQERDSILSQIIQQKVKVSGWENLTERMLDQQDANARQRNCSKLTTAI